MVRHWSCTLVHLHTARTNHTGGSRFHVTLKTEPVEQKLDKQFPRIQPTAVVVQSALNKA